MGRERGRGCWFCCASPPSPRGGCRKMNSFFSYFTKNKIDPSWAYYLLVGIPVTIAIFVYLWMRMVRVTFGAPDANPTISVEDAYLDALVNDEMVSSADEGGLSDAPDSPVRRSKRLLNRDDGDK